MRTYTKIYRSGGNYVAQSRIVHTGEALGNPRNRWSIQIMRSRNRYSGNDKRGFAVFIHAGPLRFEVGTR